MLQKWKFIINNWINCYFDKTSQDECHVNIESLLTIISNLRDNLNLDESKSSVLEAHTVEEFILEKYPGFKFKNGSIKASNEDDVYFVASLLLYFVCVNSKDVDIKSAMCSKLSGDDQEIILKFSKTLMDCSPITCEDVQAAISEACGNEMVTIDTGHTRMSVAETPPALRSLHGEVRRLQAALEAERFDRNFLQEELARTNLRVEKLLKDKEQYKLDIMNLKTKISLCCGENHDGRQAETGARESAKLTRQLEDMEERLVKTQELLDEAVYERDGLKAKLEGLKQDRDKWLALSQQESARTVQLTEELETERRQVHSLKELITELRMHNRLNRLDSSLLECDDPDASIQSLGHNLSVCSEACANIIDVQLGEERAKNTQLKQQIETLQKENEQLHFAIEEDNSNHELILKEKDLMINNLEQQLKEQATLLESLRKDHETVSLSWEKHKLKTRDIIEVKDEHIKKLNEHLVSLKQEFAELESERDALTKNIDVLIKEYNDEKQNLVALLDEEKSKYDVIFKEKDMLQKQLLEEKAAKDVLETEKIKLIATHNEVLSEKATLANELAEEKSLRQVLTEKKNELSAQKVATEKKFSKQVKQVEKKLAKEVAKVAVILQEKEQIVQQLKQEKSLRESAEKEKADLVIEKTHLEKELDEIMAVKEDLAIEVDQLFAKKESLEQNCLEQKEINIELKEDLEKERLAKNDLFHEMEVLKRDLVDHKAIQEVLNNDKKLLIDEKSMLAQSLELEKSAHDELENEKTGLCSKLKDLNEQFVSELKRKEDELERASEDLKQLAIKFKGQTELTHQISSTLHVALEKLAQDINMKEFTNTHLQNVIKIGDDDMAAVEKCDQLVYIANALYSEAVMKINLEKNLESEKAALEEAREGLKQKEIQIFELQADMKQLQQIATEAKSELIKQNENYTSALKNRHTEIQSLQHENQHLKNDLNTTKIQLDMKVNSLKELLVNNENAMDQLKEQYECQVNNLNVMVSTLTNYLEDKTAELECAGNERDWLQQVIEENHKGIKSLQNEVEVARQNLEKVISDCESEKLVLRNTLTDTETMMENQKISLNNTISQLTKANKMLHDENKSIKDLNEKKTEVFERDIKEKESALESTEKELTALKLAKQDLEQKIISQKEVSNKELGSLRAENQNKSDENRRLKDKMKALKSHKKALSQEINEQKNAIQDKENELRMMVIEKNEYETTIRNYEESESMLKNQIVQLQNKIDENETEFSSKINKLTESYQMEVEDKKVLINKLNEEVSTILKLKKELEQSEETIKILEQEKNKLIADRDDYVNKFNEIQTVFESNSAKASEEILNLKKYTTELEKNIAVLNKDKTELEENIRNLNKDNSESEQKIAKLIENKMKLEQNISKLSEDNAKLQTDNMKLIRNIDKLCEDNLKLEVNIAKLSENKMELETNIAKLNDDNVKLEHNIVKLNEDNVKLSQDITKLSENNAKLEQDIAKLSESNGKLELNIVTLNENNNKLEQEIAKLKDNIKKLEQDTTKFNEDNINLEQNIDVLNEDNTKLEQIIAKLSEDNAKLEQHVAKLSEDNTKLEHDITKLKLSTEKLNEDNTKLEQSIAKLDENKTELEYTIVKLSEDNIKLQQNIAELNKNNTKQEQSIAKLNEENIKLQQNTAELNKNNTKQEQSIAKLNEENLKLQQNIAELNKSNMKQEQSIAKLNEENIQLQQNIAELNKNNTKQEQSIAKLNEENLKLQQNIAELNENNTKQEHNIAKLNEESIKLQQNIAELNENNKKQEQSITTLNEKNTKLQENIAKLNEDKTKLGQDIAKMKEDNAELNKENCKLKENNAELVNNFTAEKAAHEEYNKQVSATLSVGLNKLIQDLKKEYISHEILQLANIDNDKVSVADKCNMLINISNMLTTEVVVRKNLEKSLENENAAVAQLGEVLKQKDKQIFELQTEVKRVQKVVNETKIELSKQNETYTTTNNNNLREIQSLQLENQSLTNDLNDVKVQLEVKVHSLKEKLVDNENLTEKLKKTYECQIENLNVMITKLTNYLKDKTAELEALRKEKDRLQQVIDENNKAIKSLEDEVKNEKLNQEKLMEDFESERQIIKNMVAVTESVMEDQKAMFNNTISEQAKTIETIKEENRSIIEEFEMKRKEFEIKLQEKQTALEMLLKELADVKLEKEGEKKESLLQNEALEKQINELKSAIQKKENEIKRLNEENNTLIATNESYKENVASLTKENNELKIKKDEIEVEFRNKVEKLTASLQEQIDNKKDLNIELDKTTNNIASMERELKDLKEKINILEQEKSDLILEKDGYLAKASEEITKSKKDVDNLVNEVNKLRLDNNAFKQEIDKLRNNNSELSKEIDRFKNENNALSMNIDKLKIDNTELLEGIDKLKTENRELLEEVSKSKSNNTELVNTIEEKITAITKLEQAIKQEQEQYKKLQDNIANEKVNLVEKCDILQNYHTKAEKELEERQKEIVSLQKEIQTLQSKVEYSITESAAKDGLISKMSKEKDAVISELNKDLLEEKVLREKYQKEFEEKIATICELKKNLNELNNDRKALSILKKENEELIKAVGQRETFAVRSHENTSSRKYSGQIAERELRDIHHQVDNTTDITHSSIESLKTITDLEKIIHDKNRTITTLQSDVTYLKTLMAESENKLLDVTKELEVSKENCQQLSTQLKKIVHQKNEEIAEYKKQVSKMSVTENRATQIIKVSAKYQAIILKRIAEIKSSTVLKELTNFGNCNTNTDNELRRSLTAGSITMEDLENFLETTERHLKKCSDKQLALQKEKDRLTEVNRIHESEIINLKKFLTELSVSFQTFSSVKDLYAQKLSRVISVQRTVRREILSLDGHVTDTCMLKLERGYAAVMQDLAECSMNLERWVERCIGRTISSEKIKQAFMSDNERSSLAPSSVQNAGLEVQLDELEKSFQKLLEEVSRAQKGEGAKDAQAVTVMEVRAEYEDKLNRMKAKMKQLYTEQIAVFKEKQKEEIAMLERELARARDTLSQSSRAYEEHIRSLTTELWSVGEKFLMQKDEANYLRRKQRSGSLMSLQHVHSSGFVPPQEDPGRPSDTQSLRSLPVNNNNNNNGAKREGRGLHMSDEEGEVFDNRYLRELNTPRRENDPARLSELRWRNSLCPPHLKSSYPAETQFAPVADEDDIKAMGGPGTAPVRQQRKEVGIIAYKKPGPPTPSKQAGRLSATDSELRESMRVEAEPQASRKTSTPSRIRSLFRSNKTDTTEGTPRSRRLSNIFRKK